MAINKVVLHDSDTNKDTVLIDISEDTVNSNVLVAGETAHNKAGDLIRGNIKRIGTYDNQILDPFKETNFAIIQNSVYKNSFQVIPDRATVKAKLETLLGETHGSQYTLNDVYQLCIDKLFTMGSKLNVDVRPESNMLSVSKAMDKVSLEPVETGRSVKYTSNGKYTVYSSPGYVMKSVAIDVNVPTGGSPSAKNVNIEVENRGKVIVYLRTFDSAANDFITHSVEPDGLITITAKTGSTFSVVNELAEPFLIDSLEGGLNVMNDIGESGYGIEGIAFTLGVGNSNSYVLFA